MAADPIIVATLMVRNEVDIIDDCLDWLYRWGVRNFVILDGRSDDGTYEKLTGFWENLIRPNKDSKLYRIDCPDPGNKFADSQRNLLLDAAREMAGTEDFWVLSVDADEIYLTNPLQAIRDAEAVGATAIWSDVPQFWLTHKDIKDGLLMESRVWPAYSIVEQRRWYSWGHTGVFMWKNRLDHYYPADTPKRTPEVPGVSWRDWQRYGPTRPICGHYPFRSLPQAMRRMTERQERGGRKYFGKYFQNWIIDEQAAKLSRLNGDVMRYVMNGNIADQFNTFRTHERVHQYMAGELDK